MGNQMWVDVEIVRGVAVAKCEGRIIARRKPDWAGATPTQAMDALMQSLLSNYRNITICSGENPVFEKIDGKLVWSAFGEVA